MAHGGAHAAAAAAEKQRKEREEEEQLSTYSSRDLTDGWEFKIIRSTISAFRNPKYFARMLEEESGAGWELAEKIDDQRARMKRPASFRQRDVFLSGGIDPYRVSFDKFTTGVAILVGFLVFLFALIAVVLITVRL